MRHFATKSLKDGDLCSGSLKVGGDPFDIKKMARAVLVSVEKLIGEKVHFV